MSPHNDLPTLEDKCSWEKEVDRVSRRIESCFTPHVLGIHGDWGSGKTSFMRQIQHLLGGQMPNDGTVNPNGKKALTKAYVKEKNSKIITIWFDAWRYQNEPVPIVALLHEMRQQIAFFPAAYEKVKKLTYVALTASLDSLIDVAKKIGLESFPSAEKIRSVGESWEKANYSESLSSNAVRQQLQKAIESLLPSDNDSARVVIFIDDLDRCNPKSAMRLLEGLKIYLSIPRCVFVLGMNERILVDILSEETSDGTEDKRLRASHYLEKICSDLYRLPSPSSTLNLFQQWVKDLDHRALLGVALKDINCLPPNPRRLKALANQWVRFAAYENAPNGDIELRLLWAKRILIVAYIHQFHRDLWERWHYRPDFWIEIKGWCVGLHETSIPTWAESLQRPYKVINFDEVTAKPSFSDSYLNPGDIQNFWIASLIRDNADYLNPVDFKHLLKNIE